MNEIDIDKVLIKVKEMFEQLGKLQNHLLSLEKHINNIDGHCNDLLSYLISSTKMKTSLNKNNIEDNPHGGQ